MPYVSYDEIISAADEMLDGYEPAEEMKMKYGIMTMSELEDM